jgi:hypothetical protein
MSAPKGYDYKARSWHRIAKRKPEEKFFEKRDRLSTKEILDAKEKIILLLEQGQARTFSEAAELAGVSPARAHAWAIRDEEWGSVVREARKVLADRSAAKLFDNNNVIGHIFLAKANNPGLYRDDAAVPVSSEPVRKLLEELREAAKRPDEPKTDAKSAKEVLADEKNPFQEVVARINKPTEVKAEVKDG